MGIAALAVKLDLVMPELLEIATSLQDGAQSQDEVTARVRESTQSMTSSLLGRMSDMRDSSDQMLNSVSGITKVANVTRILALNTNIQASRANTAGATFQVIANEVKRLAGETSTSVQKVGDSVLAMRTKIQELQGMEESLAQVDGEMEAIRKSAEMQAEVANQVRDLVDKAHGLCSNLILQIGTFRFDVHRHAMDIVESLAQQLAAKFGVRSTMESVLAERIQNNPSLELLYVTDTQGKQVVRNIGPKNSDPNDGLEAYGKSWSNRPWFQGALQSKECQVSDIYLSSATGAYCFTVSRGLWHKNGDAMGVLAADLNVSALLSNETSHYSNRAAVKINPG